MTNPKTIWSELKSFYSSLYKDNDCRPFESFLFDTEFPSLSEESRLWRTDNECFPALQIFQKNKTRGNDGLTAEFYLTIAWKVHCGQYYWFIRIGRTFNLAKTRKRQKND